MILWIGVALALVYAIVSSLVYKTKVGNKSKADSGYVAATIVSELQDKFRDGSDDSVDVYQLGRQLGFSTQQVRAALSEFKKDAELDAVILSERYVKLGIRGQMMCRH
jgi:MFS superfamily sulfate permease-like transporter